MYAQTILQLYAQLLGKGISDGDLGLIRDGYRLAADLFPGHYRENGKPFISHVIGTASILAGLEAGPELVASGLIHSVYKHGDFGYLSLLGLSARRRMIIRRIGANVERYAYRFGTMRWNGRWIRRYVSTFDSLDGFERDVLLMRLANAVDDHTDHGLAYCRNAVARYRDEGKDIPIMMELAVKLGCPVLEDELRACLEPPPESWMSCPFQGDDYDQGVFRVSPQSYRLRSTIGLAECGRIVDSCSSAS